MIRVELKNEEQIEKALRRFKKQCDREGLTRDMRKSSYYEKPSERRKRQKREQEKARAKADRLVLKRKLKARKQRIKQAKQARQRLAARAGAAESHAKS